MNSPLHVHFINKNQRGFRSLLDQSRQHVASTSSSLGTSGSRSWQGTSGLSTAHGPTVDVNARDHLGRTVLHLAAASFNPSTPDFVRMLLAHPSTNINLQDYESHWTALHRALWIGNLPVVILLLQRPDIELYVKDFDRYTAFDIYNSTVEGTNPPGVSVGKKELFVWGSNRNAALGLGDAGDRSFPEHVKLVKNDDRKAHDPRFTPVYVQDISMARLHTVIVTSEPFSNVRACGFGSGGRLAPSQHTQYTLAPLPHVAHLSIASVALGQDHTLALTSAGNVYSWGFNRFHQLGYLIEAKDGSVAPDQVQPTARKIFGALKRQVVIGVAACKIASSCWTATEVFTWGTNRGQLGYSKSAVPTQTLPRKVPQITQPVISITLSNTALCALLAITQDILCIYNDTSFKINFPLNVFPSSINRPYRPPQTSPRTSITKVVCCEDVSGAGQSSSSSGGGSTEATFAALSAHGDVFVWGMNDPLVDMEAVSERGATGGAVVKPQRVWALRRQMSAVQDVALSADGTILLCTRSGHVFIRSRNAKSTSTGNTNLNVGSSFGKFHRIPYLNRVVEVRASPAGAFAALRVDAAISPIPIAGSAANGMAMDLAGLMAWLPHTLPQTSLVPVYQEGELSAAMKKTPAREEEDEEQAEEEETVRMDIWTMRRMLETLHSSTPSNSGENAKRQPSSLNRTSKGGNITIEVDSKPVYTVVAHLSLLSLRSQALGKIIRYGEPLAKGRVIIMYSSHSSSSPVPSDNLRGFLAPPRGCLTFKGIHPLSVLVLLQFLYTDDVSALWDRRVAVPLEGSLGDKNPAVKPAEIRADLLQLASLLGLKTLAEAVGAASKKTPSPTMKHDLTKTYRVFNSSQPLPLNEDSPPSTTSPPTPEYLAPFDVMLQLMDRRVWCHSSILRVRSRFFESFFDEDEWTRKRWIKGANLPDVCGQEAGDHDVLIVNFCHLEWKAMEFVMRFICLGVEDETLFDEVEFVNTVDERIDHVFLVMAAANELLLDKLILICSNVILEHVSITNVYSLLSDATFLHAKELVQALQHYIAMNLESLLLDRRGLLDELASMTPELVNSLTLFVRQRQEDKLPLTRSGRLVGEAMTKWAQWLALQDIPQPHLYHHQNRSPAKPLDTRGASSHSLKLSPVSPSTSPTSSKMQHKSSNIGVASGDVPIPTASPLARSSNVGEAPQGADSIGISEGLGETPLASSGGASPQTPTAPWKRAGVSQSTERLDMRAIMALEAEAAPSASSGSPLYKVLGFQVSGGSPNSTSTTVPRWIPKLSQRDRRKSQQLGTLDPSSSPPAGAPPSTNTPPSSLLHPDPGSSPWKAVPKASASMTSIVESQTQALRPSEPLRLKVAPASPSGLTRSLTASDNANVSGSKAPSSGPLGNKAGPPGLGPTIRPTRAHSSTPSEGISGQRRAQNKEAWTAPPASMQTELSVEGAASSSGASFIAIQEHQRELERAGTFKISKRSLLEIQEEEQAHRAEAEFLVWWTEEEERVKAEQQAILEEIEKVQRRQVAHANRPGGSPRKVPSHQKKRNGPRGPTPGQPLPPVTPGSAPAVATISASPSVAIPIATPSSSSSRKPPGSRGKPKQIRPSRPSVPK